MAQDTDKPLASIRDHLTEAVHIAKDYIGVAVEIHPADRVGPAVDLLDDLVRALGRVEQLRAGHGRRGIHVGDLAAG